jgi:hypothetical protein
MPLRKILEMIVPVRMEARETMPTNAAWRSLLRTRFLTFRVSGLLAQDNSMTLLDIGSFPSAMLSA